METTTTTTENETVQLNVINNSIMGNYEDGLNLYMVVWQRIANSGFYYCWAKDETQALGRGFNPEFVKHTIVKIDQNNMPVEIGLQK